MKGGVEAPPALVDLRRLGLNEHRRHRGRRSPHRLGRDQQRDRQPSAHPLAVSGAVAVDPVRRDHPAAKHGDRGWKPAATHPLPLLHGNRLRAMQQARPGSGCAAKDSFNREHAIFGASDACVAIHPSDMAVALAILDATRARARTRRSRARSPSPSSSGCPVTTPERDNTLHPAELIVGIELPPSPYAEHSWYLKVRDRHSYAFALVSVAAGLHIVDGTIRAAAIAMGGVAANAVACRRGRSQPARAATHRGGVPAGRAARDGRGTTVEPERFQGRPRHAQRGARIDDGARPKQCSVATPPSALPVRPIPTSAPASTTLAAMAFSAGFPHDRGS